MRRCAQTLGPHVKQAGSLVAPDRLRFDFVHSAAVTAEQRQGIERMVNEAILANSPVHTAVEGHAAGDRRRAPPRSSAKNMATGCGWCRLAMDAFSTELCGGTHVAATGDIGLLVVTEESGVAAGVRRVEALTGAGALAYLRDALDALHRAAAAANAPPADLAARIEAQAATLTKAQREVRDLKTKLAMGGGGAADSSGDSLDGGTTSPWSCAGWTGSIAKPCGHWRTRPSRRSPTGSSFLPGTPERAG